MVKLNTINKIFLGAYTYNLSRYCYTYSYRDKSWSYTDNILEAIFIPCCSLIFTPNYLYDDISNIEKRIRFGKFEKPSIII